MDRTQKIILALIIFLVLGTGIAILIIYMKKKKALEIKEKENPLAFLYTGIGQAYQDGDSQEFTDFIQNL